jgi:hypothetical protein
MPGTTLFAQGAIQFELEETLGIAVDVQTPGDLPARFRDQVLKEAIAAPGPLHLALRVGRARSERRAQRRDVTIVDADDQTFGGVDACRDRQNRCEHNSRNGV